MALLLAAMPPSLDAAPAIDQELRLRYSFNEGGGNTVTDSSGWLRHAAVSGSVAWARPDGSGEALFGNSLRFDGGPGYLELAVPDAPVLQESPLSISIWIRPAAAGAGSARTIVSNGGLAPGSFTLALDDGDRLVGEVWLAGETVPRRVQSGPLAHEEWAHVVLVAEEEGLRLFLLPAGASVHQEIIGAATPAPATPGTPLPLVIGADASAKGRRYQGLVDELRIYGRGLAPGEVVALGNRVGGEAGLIFYESFDDVGGLQANEAIVTAGSLVAGRFDRAMALASGTIAFPVINNRGQPNLDMHRGAVKFLYRPEWPAGNLNHRLFMTDNFCAGGNILAVGSFQGYLNFNYGGNATSSTASNVTTRAIEPAGASAWSNGEWHEVEIAWDMTGAAGQRYAAVVVNGNLFDFSYMDEVPAGQSPSHFIIGRACGASWNFNGAIDELRIYQAPTFDIADPVSEYVRRSRGNGLVEDHETIHDSPDPPAVAPGNGGFSFFLKPAFTALFGNYVPAPDELLPGAARFTAAGNSHETLFINAYAHGSPGRVEVSLAGGALRNGEAVLDNVRVLAVRNWWQGSRPESRRISRLPHFVPELLVHDDTVITSHSGRPDPDHDYRAIEYDGGYRARLPDFGSGSDTLAMVDFLPQTSRQFAIVVQVPPGAAGTYTGTLEFTDPASGGALLASLPVTLEVLDLDLPPSGRELLIYHRGVYDPGSCLPWGSTDYLGACRSLLADTGQLSGEERYWREVDDIAAHGFNGILTYMDPRSQLEADAYVGNLARSGLSNRLVFTDNFPLGGPASNSVYSPYPRLAMEGARAAGLLRAGATFATRDEPGYRSARNQTNVIGWHLANIIDLHAVGAEAITSLYYDTELCLRDGGPEAVPGGIGCEGSALDRLNAIFPGALPPLAPRLGSGNWPVGSYPQLDIASLYLEDRHEASSAPAYFDYLLAGGKRPAGRREIAYWHPTREDPRINRFVGGTFLYLTGLDGLFPYSYYDIDERGDPFNDFDALSGPGAAVKAMAVYPSASGPVSTMQWEALRAGLDDYRYLRAWEQLRDVVARNGRHDAMPSTDAVQAALARHRGALANGLDGIPGFLEVADFDSLRALLIAEITGLRAVDTDGDGVPDYRDNCMLVANPGQHDGDGDGRGNACDGDLNNDGLVNFADLALFRSRFGSPDPVADLNGDGAVNFADLALFLQLFGAGPGPSAFVP